ncbi:MAG TPA: DUF1553 domain-containing protein [Gemmataceae bacterium]|nr:DUF1553 domain-containing protein [Gemmataceae bacterium]
MAGSVTIHPASLDLRHHRQPHALQVLATTADGYSLDLHSQAKFTSADPRIATVDEQGWVHPVSSGATTLTVAVAGQTKTVPVKVQLPAQEPPSSFRHEVMPVLTRAGCNAGACHGYSLGKNGFKLSLRGQDPPLDYLAITKDLFGRRVNVESPETSLLLAKARGDVPHEGGVRFRRNSLSNDIITKWIQQGTPGDLADTVHVVGVRLVPDKLVLRPGQKHRLQLIAEYDDGNKRDVTRLGIWTANNDRYAAVDDEGLVIAGDAGETAIVGRFERTFAATGVLVLQPNDKFVPTPVPQGNLIDKHVVEKLNHLKITPSPLADDEEFLRRVSLDLIGVQPKPDDVRSFLANKDPRNRDKVIDGLFERPEFVDHWSLKWGDLLQNSRNSASSQSVYLFREFIRGAVAENMPLDEFARRLLTARGGSLDDPASVYLSISKDANDTVERVTQVFCGVRMLCARCHSHPLENWTQGDYYGLESFFTQVSTRPDGRFPTVPNAKTVKVTLAAGPATNPRTGLAQMPKFLGGEQLPLQTDRDRREAYAAWLTSPKNPFFARSLTNRVWSYFFHRGIIEPVDDVRSTNPPINPALLDALTKDFVEHKFDVRHLMQCIATSQTYQRSVVPTESNRHDEQNFSHAIPRRLPAEALLDSLVQATGVPENFGGAPPGFRAAQLPDGTVESTFLKLFGKPQRAEACECERDNGSNMLQALHFINGKSILDRVQNPNGRAALLLRQKLSDEQTVAELYLWCLARHPKAAEVKVGLEFIKSYGDKRTEAVQDLAWALLNSKDFLLTH